MPKISQIDEVPCQAEVQILQKITLKKKTIGVTNDCYGGLRERLFNRAVMLSISTRFTTIFGGTIMSISTANDLMDARGVYLILKAQTWACNR